jgi:RNA polymerase sigma-70 factor, ECF subfamily
VAAHAAPEPITPEWLFRTYARYVAAIAYRLLGRRDEVDDLVQDVFVAAQRSLIKLRDPNAAKAWLATITVRKARRRMRLRKLWMALGVDREEAVDSTMSEAPGPHTLTLLQQMFTHLDQLPTNQRIAWSLRYLEGQSLEAVAATCGCSLATAKRWIAAATTSLDQAEVGHV